MLVCAGCPPSQRLCLTADTGTAPAAFSGLLGWKGMTTWQEAAVQRELGWWEGWGAEGVCVGCVKEITDCY